MAVLQKLSVKGGVGRIIEYAGEGVKTLSVPERATITNMGTELGATTSIFPSDEITKAFLEAQGRGDCWVELKPDEDAVYDEVMDLDLSALEPLAACPHSPDAVKSVRELGPIHIDQCCIGSCTNSSYLDMMRVASILKGKTVHPDVDLTIGCGSKQVYNMLALNGALADIIAAGARVLECTCGPCIGMGQSPRSGGRVPAHLQPQLRGPQRHRRRPGLPGEPGDRRRLRIGRGAHRPRTLGDYEPIRPAGGCSHQRQHDPDPRLRSRTMDQVEIQRGPNIKPFPVSQALPESIEKKAILKVGDNITTDHIMPAGAKILPYRSNIPYLSQFCFGVCDKEFPQRCKEEGGGIVIGGSNYGQGSSREHAALVPLYLGIKAVVAKSYARIHCANLANAGLIPLQFVDEADYDRIDQMDELRLPRIKEELKQGTQVTLEDATKGFTIQVEAQLTQRQREMVLAGGLLNYTKHQAE